MKKLFQFVTASVAALGMLVGSQAYGHGIWFTERSSQLALVYGVGADDLDTVKRLDKITSITGYDSDWGEVDAKLIKAGPMVLVGGDDYPEAVSGVMNNGVWAKTKDGKWHAKGRGRSARCRDRRKRHEIRCSYPRHAAGRTRAPQSNPANRPY